MKPYEPHPYLGAAQPGPTRPLSDPQPLDLLARLLLSLSYGDMLRLAADLHSDIETHNPKPIDIADQLYRWAHRVGGDS